MRNFLRRPFLQNTSAQVLLSQATSGYSDVPYGEETHTFSVILPGRMSTIKQPGERTKSVSRETIQNQCFTHIQISQMI